MLAFLCVLLSFYWRTLVRCNEIHQQHPLLHESAATPLQELRLNFSSPAPHIFSSIHGLLRQGYNTFYPNGFSVVPCEIPAFTPFYHGWLNEDLPQGPEWLASTPEMAYGIMGSTPNSFLSTYQTTQTAKCLYFDGASGALVTNTTVDTQMLLLYGNTTGPPGKSQDHDVDLLWDEYARAQRLCGWLRERNLDVPGQGIEGIVRMSAAWELIWCDFSSASLRLVSKFNASVPLLGYNRTTATSESVEAAGRTTSSGSDAGQQTNLPAPEWDIDWEREPFVASQMWDWFTSASRSYSSEDLASSRETSFRLLDTDIVSLYSPEYQRHQIIIAEKDRERLNLTLDGHWRGVGNPQARQAAMKELIRRRSKHRVGNLDSQDLASFRQNIEHMINRVVSRDSHYMHNRQAVSWSRTCDAIVNSFAKRLMQFQRLLQHDHLKEPTSSSATKQQFVLLRERTHALIMPFFEYSSNTGAPNRQQHEKLHASLSRCKRGYLPWPAPDEAQTAEPKEGSSDHFAGQAIEEVMHGICSVLISVGTSVETIWLRHFNDASEDLPDEQRRRVRTDIQIYHDRIEELTAWLGWSPHWMGCDRLCAWDEECYLPIAPLMQFAFGHTPADLKEAEYDLWHPRCLKITDFPAHQGRG